MSNKVTLEFASGPTLAITETTVKLESVGGSSAADVASSIATHAALVNGVHGLTTNISAALTAAASPSAGNPFVTATSSNVWTLGQTFQTRAVIGTNAPSADDSGLLFARAVSGSGGGSFGHAARDESTFTSTVAGDAYASFDSIATIQGTQHYSHHSGFQFRPIMTNTTKIDAIYGLTTSPTINGPVASCYSVYAINPTGSSTIDVLAGLYIDDNGLTKGAANYVIYSGNTNTPSYHAGFFQTGSDITAAGKITGSNTIYSDARNSQGIGTGVPAVSTLGYFNAFYGYNAGKSAAGDAQTFCTMIGTAAGYGNVNGSNNTFIGSYAGYNATGSGNVFLGTKAGRDETGSNKLYIDDTETATPLIYGEFHATLTSAKIQFNAGYHGFFGHAAAIRPAKATYNNWASLGDVVAALVSIGIFDTA